MSAFWSDLAEVTIRGLLAHPFQGNNEDVTAEALRLEALPVGWDLWSHYFVRPDGSLIRVNMEGIDDGFEKEEVFADRAHSLWGLLLGSQIYPDLVRLLPAREAGAVDCECTKLPTRLAPVFCPHCGGVGWLPPAAG